MSRNYYSEIYLHITWHTKESLPLLTPRVEPFVHDWIQRRIVATEGAYVYEIGGTPTHVHLCVTVPPTMLIADFIGQLKGGSSHETNGALGANGKVLQWQTGYGVVSFGAGNLEWVRRYIRNQREHHERGSARPRLERITEPAP